MEAIELLANHGIEVSRDGTILQDKSCKLYSDGQIHDFGRGGLHYFTAKEFLDERTDLHDAPIQASTLSVNPTPKYNLQNIYNSYKQQFKDVDESFKLKAMHELLPPDYWHIIPDYIGYSFKDSSLTLSVFNDADVEAVTIRKNGTIKWKTFGSKIYIPTKLTGKKDVYLASGMGEILLMDLMGWDYIGLQSDGISKHLQKPDIQIEHLIILPDNDKSFMDKVDEIVSIITPKTASIVKWEHSDPRDATKLFSTRESLQTAIDENLKTIVIEPVADDDAGVEYEYNLMPHLHTPVNPVTFADKLKNTLIAFNPKFIVSPAMIDVFHGFASTFNTVVYDNQNSATAIAKRYIVPLTTGSAKTTSAKLYLAEAGVSGLLIVRKAQDAINAVRDINMFAGSDIARCTYSIDAKNGRPDTTERVDASELHKHQVVVITHAMFQKLHEPSTFKLDEYQLYNGSSREAIIIDERINLTREESFDNQELNDAIKLLRVADTDDELTMYLESLTNLNEIIFTHQEKGDKTNFSGYKPEMQSFMAKGTDMFIELIKLIESGRYKLTYKPKIRGMRTRDSDKFEMENVIIKLIHRIMFVIDGDMTLCKSGIITTVSRVEDFSLKFGSVAVLDATANVNKGYEPYLRYKPDSTVMFNKPEIRDYSNVTFHIAKGFKQSKSGLYASKSENEIVQIVKDYLDLLYPLVDADDNMLVVVHKDVLPTFMEQCRMDNITFINWGNHAGSNQWSHYNKACIIGWFRLPQHIYANMLNVGADGYSNYEPELQSYDKDVTALADSTVSDDMVQFYNRIRSRVAIDTAGNCEDVDFYLFSDDTSKSKSIIARMIQEFDHATVTDWSVSPATAIKKKRTKSIERADNIIATLKLEATKKEDVLAEVIRNKLGTTKQAFVNTMKTKYMQDELAYFGIKYTRLESVQGKPSIFDFTNTKNI